MIKVLPDMPEAVTGIRMSGRLRGDDLREFKPAMEELNVQHTHRPPAAHATNTGVVRWISGW